MNGSCMPRSESREATSAAGSIASGAEPDEDGFLSGSCQELELDDLRHPVERRDVSAMTEKSAERAVASQTSLCTSL